jgi:uncharacterized protein (TIGR03083 family)
VIRSCRYLPAAIEQMCALLRSLDDTSTPTGDGTWTVGETAAHVIGGAKAYTGYIRGEPSVVKSPAEMNAMHAARFAATPTRDGPGLADLMAEAEGGFVRAADGVAPDAEVNWHFGLRMSADAAAGIRLVEQYVHGWDIAMAVGRPWAVPDEAGATAMAAVSPLYPYWVSADRAGDAAITVLLRPQGGDPLLASIRQGRMVFDPEAAPDAVVDGPGGAFPLLVYGRADAEELGMRVSGPDPGALDRWLTIAKSP